MKINYDPECERLARYFLEQENGKVVEKDVAALAGAIQLAIETWWSQAPEKDDE